MYLGNAKPIRTFIFDTCVCTNRVFTAREPFLSVHPSVSAVSRIIVYKRPDVLAGCRFRTMR